METKQKHTELPMILPLRVEDGGGFFDIYDAADNFIAGTGSVLDNKKHARYIVLSANYHERLVDELRGFVDYYAGNKAAMLGNGYARKFHRRAESLLAEIEKEGK